MADPEHDARMSENPSPASTGESAGPDGSAMTVARLLANPRRIRRD